ncbi:MAG: hypothetical protein ACRDAP_09335 [Shewanella sp.]
MLLELVRSPFEMKCQPLVAVVVALLVAESLEIAERVVAVVEILAVVLLESEEIAVLLVAALPKIVQMMCLPLLGC